MIQFLLIYWKSFVIILWPLILLPIVIIETTEVRSSFFESSFNPFSFKFVYTLFIIFSLFFSLFHMIIIYIMYIYSLSCIIIRKRLCIDWMQVKAMRCLYVIGLMAIFWMTEVLPLPITGLIPIFLYPLLGIMSTGDTCMCYMNDTTMMFIGSMVIAIVIENSGLHIRIALLIIKLIGCSHRR